MVSPALEAAQQAALRATVQELPAKSGIGLANWNWKVIYKFVSERFADEAHFRADAELRGKWVLRGEPALTDSGSPRRGEKASYYSAVCLETGEVEWMGLEGNSNSETSAAFFKQLRQRHTEPLKVIWDNAPAHRGEAVGEYLRTPDSAWGW